MEENMSGIVHPHIKVETEETKLQFLRALENYNSTTKKIESKVIDPPRNPNLHWTELADQVVFEVSIKTDNPFLAFMGKPMEVTYEIPSIEIMKGLFDEAYLASHGFDRLAQHADELHDLFMNQTHGDGYSIDSAIADGITYLLGHPATEIHIPGLPGVFLRMLSEAFKN